MPEESITVRQLNAVLFVFLVASFDVFEPRFVAAAAGPDAPLSVALATLFALLITGALLSLGLRFPKADVMDYSVSLLGSPLGQAAGALYLFTLVIGAGGRSLAKVGMIGSAAFGWAAPALLAAILLLIIVAALLVERGLKTIALVCEYAAPVAVILVLATGLSVLGKVNWTNFTPLTAGWGPVVKGALSLLSRFSLAYVLLFLLPRTRRAGYTTGPTLATVVLVGFLMSIGTLSIGLYGAGATAASFIPSLQLLSDSVFGRTPGIFNLAVVVWMLGMTVKMTVAYWLLTTALAETSGTPARRFLVPVGAAVWLLAVLLRSNPGQTYVFLGQYFPYLSYATGIGIPLLLLLAARFHARQPAESAPEA